MNKRIEKLSDEAYDLASSQHSIHSPALLRTYTEKFAELIVKECADIADQESKDQRTDHGRQAADRIWHTIKNRFGITE
jgi:hypothetical protein